MKKNIILSAAALLFISLFQLVVSDVQAETSPSVAVSLDKAFAELEEFIKQTNTNAMETTRLINELVEQYNLLQKREALAKTVAENIIPIKELDILIANINTLYKQEIDPSTKRFLGKKGNIVNLFDSFKNPTDTQKKKMMEIEQTLIAISNTAKKLRAEKRKSKLSSGTTTQN